MKDKLFLKWIHDRLHYVHGEDINVDYLHKLRAIIYHMNEFTETPNCLTPDQTNEVKNMEV